MQWVVRLEKVVDGDMRESRACERVSVVMLQGTLNEPERHVTVRVHCTTDGAYNGVAGVLQCAAHVDDAVGLLRAIGEGHVHDYPAASGQHGIIYSKPATLHRIRAWPR